MNRKLGLAIGWTAAILVAAFNLFAAVMKLFVPIVPGTPAAEMQQRFGLTDALHFQLGILELFIVVLFLIPRTMTVGFVLMVGYMGGVLATNLTHGFTHMEALPIYVTFLLLTVSAWYRTPELTARLFKRPIQ